MAVETHIQLTIKTDNPFEARAKMEHLKELSKLNTDSLSKLAELAKNAKAITQLNNSFGFIKSFLR